MIWVGWQIGIGWKMDLAWHDRRISYVYFSPSRFLYYGWRDYPLNSLSRLFFALLCFPLSDFIFYWSWLVMQKVQRQFMVGAKHHPRLRPHPSYPHYQDCRLFPPSPKPIFYGILRLGGMEAGGIKSCYFYFVIFLLRGLSAFYLCVFFYLSLTKLRDPWCYDLTG